MPCENCNCADCQASRLPTETTTKCKDGREHQLRTDVGPDHKDWAVCVRCRADFEAMFGRPLRNST